METNLASLFIITAISLYGVGWLLVYLYRHDHPKHKEKNFDYWS